MPKATAQHITPHIDDIRPAAALPLGEVELLGSHLGPASFSLPSVLVDGQSTQVLMCRPTRLAIHVPEQATTGTVEVSVADSVSNAAPLRVARLLSDGLHPVTSPAVSPSGMIYTTISGSRGKQTPVSIVRIGHDGTGTPFASGILNATGLAFNHDGELFVSSRALGSIYRIDASGDSLLYAEGMGIATGIVFDAEGNLFVGDRSGTIFKINPQKQIFVHATLEPSVSAYHLAINAEGTLFVSGPTISSNESIWAIDPDGSARLWYRGLGRPQGMAMDADNNLHVVACLHGRHGVVRITPQGEASMVLAGNGLVGIAFSPLGTAALSTSQSIYDVDLGVEGLFLGRLAHS